MTQLSKNLKNLSSRLRESYDDPIERFVDIRAYLDECDSDSIDISILERLFEDDDDTIRAEAADFAVISGGLSADFLVNVINKETSDLVYPRLWLALARTNSDVAKIILSKRSAESLSQFERSFYYGAAYLASGNPFYLYNLCAIACSKDIAASYSAVDVIYIVAGHRKALLEEVLDDLRKMEAENADKASAVFRIEGPRKPKAR